MTEKRKRKRYKHLTTKEPPIVYIHYGSDVYDPKLVVKENEWSSTLMKPDMGLWACRKCKKVYSWKDYCEYEYPTANTDFTKSFEFTLKPTAKILRIYRDKQLAKYIRTLYLKNGDGIPYLDTLTLERRYDGIEVFFSNDWNNMRYGNCSAYSCDSICVWNPDVISLVERRLK